MDHQHNESSEVELTCTSEPVADQPVEAVSVSAQPGDSKLTCMPTRVSELEISPYPHVAREGNKLRKVNSSCVLTSMPNKKMLEEKHNKKALPKKGQKRIAFHEMELDTEVEAKKPRTRKTKAVKNRNCRMPMRTRKHPATAKAKTCDGLLFYCIYCRDLFTDPPTEMWVQCSGCMQWCHESCAPTEPGDKDFICDYCDH